MSRSETITETVEIYDARHQRNKKLLFSQEITYPANETPSEARKLGLAVEAAYRKGQELQYAALSGVNLDGMVLYGADLSYADLSDASMRGTFLGGAILTDANLKNADLTGADFNRCNVSGALLPVDWPAQVNQSRGLPRGIPFLVTEDWKCLTSTYLTNPAGDLKLTQLCGTDLFKYMKNLRAKLAHFPNLRAISEEEYNRQRATPTDTPPVPATTPAGTVQASTMRERLLREKERKRGTRTLARILSRAAGGDQDSSTPTARRSTTDRRPRQR
ncbi:MAG: pentapeptide repeat-containing protein [Alphaproteobacteria bacterium]|nr:pentapeptide repeat-containing protein [Alphaproteobacteria bacterium]